MSPKTTGPSAPWRVLRRPLGWVLAAIPLVSGCSLYRSLEAEAHANRALRQYVSDLTYPMSPEQILPFIERDILRHHRRETETNPFYDSIASANIWLAGAIPITIRGEDAQLRQLPTDSPPESLQHDLRPQPGDGSIEIESLSEIYRVTTDATRSHTAVHILDKERWRQYTRELELYGDVYPEQARGIREKVRAESPDVHFQPWG